MLMSAEGSAGVLERWGTGEHNTRQMHPGRSQGWPSLSGYQIQVTAIGMQECIFWSLVTSASPVSTALA